MNRDVQFDDLDPFDDPAWQNLKPAKRRHSRHIGCPVDWMAWVLPLVRSKEQLALALYLYRRCHICHSDTVSVPTEELMELGLGRWTKYRRLFDLEKVGILRVQEQHGRKTVSVQLLHWPNPPSELPRTPNH